MHERRDRLEMAIVEEMLLKKSGHKDQLDSQHRQKNLLDKYMESSKALVDSYKEHELYVRPKNDIHKAINEFYTLLKKITYHSNDLDETGIDPLDSVIEKPPEVLEVKATEKLVEFTDEEAYGRYLDLFKCHEAFLQVVKKDEAKPNYLTFLQKFDQFFVDIPRDKKLNQTYKEYVEQMLEYFRDYSRRAKPLFDYNDLEREAEDMFKQQWDSKSVNGWFDAHEVANECHQTNEPMIELLTYKSCQELEQLGLECLKKELQVRGLKCGGTLNERAHRLWSIRGKAPHEIDDSLRAPGPGDKKGKKKQGINSHYIASMEAKLKAYSDFYADHRQATVENVQRKQARTADERNDSDEDISDVEEDEDDDQNDVVYNPKNLPLGWDGKPIPYWLYKLHGLNLTYTCEICGNATYKGPKTFQRHFAEQRHAHGMKCLGIPNTAHFANITKIQDAITLWDKLKTEKQRDQFVPLVEEEYEDSQGNVVNKKTYEDLKRQGLL